MSQRNRKATQTSRKIVRQEKTVAPMVVREARRPSHEEIAQRAFEIYAGRGFVHGHHEQDWLRAEAELTGAV